MISRRFISRCLTAHWPGSTSISPARSAPISRSACTIQARRFDTLTAALQAGRGDALIAAIANTASSRATVDFTAPYYTTPARFVARLNNPIPGVTPEALAGHPIGVQAGTAHQAFLTAFFSQAKIMAFADQEALRAALREGKAEAIFGDGIALSLWINGTESAGCCAFQGGPFTESYYFGNGISIAVAKSNPALRNLLDYELEKLSRGRHLCRSLSQIFSGRILLAG